MDEENKDGGNGALKTPEELKAEAFAKDPDGFIAIKDLDIAARFTEEMQIEVLIGSGLSKDQLLHLRAVLDDKIQDIVDMIKMQAAQKAYEEQKLKQQLANPKGGVMNFARRFKR